MEELYLAICDDEVDIWSIVTGAVVNAFKKHNANATVETFRSAYELEARMKEQYFDLIFLDIEMPGVDGISLAKKIRANYPDIEIIFISNREDLVFDALRANPRGFIRKSKFLEDTKDVIDQWFKQRPVKDLSVLMVQGQAGTQSVPLNNIIYIEGLGKIQEIHTSTDSDTIEMHHSMKELEENLSTQGFLRIHRGYLVNYRFIKRLENRDAVLTNGERLPMSRQRVQEIRNQYLSLMQGGGNVFL